MTWTVSAGLATALSAQPAEAQLGKLKKTVSQAATAATGTPAPAATAGASSSQVVAIDDASITAFIAAYQPQRSFYAANPIPGVSPAVHAAAQAKYDQWNSCVNAAASSAAPSANFDSDKYADYTTQMTAVLTQAGQLTTSNPAQAQVLRDSAAVLQYQAMALMMPAVGKCGAPPKVPPAADPSAGPQAPTIVTPQAQAQYTRRQLGLLRERIAFWVLFNGKQQGQYTTYSADEVAALEARKADLQQLIAYLEDPRVKWATWQELPQW